MKRVYDENWIVKYIDPNMPELKPSTKVMSEEEIRRIDRIIASNKNEVLPTSGKTTLDDSAISRIRSRMVRKRSI